MCPVMWAFTPTGVLKQKKKMQPSTLFQISKLERNMFFLTFTQKWATFRLKMNSADFKDIFDLAGTRSTET